MYKTLLPIILICTLFASCKKEQNPFEISKHHIGLLTDSTKVKDLKFIFIHDSIPQFSSGNEAIKYSNTFDVFNNKGQKLLILTPERAQDSTAVIENVQIIDPQYKTAKGISTQSTFKEIRTAYKISKIDNLINSVLLNVKEINASFVIDKKELPPNLRFDRNLKFEEVHIPDEAKIKYFFLNWND